MCFIFAGFFPSTEVQATHIRCRDWLNSHATTSGFKLLMMLEKGHFLTSIHSAQPSLSHQTLKVSKPANYCNWSILFWQFFCLLYIFWRSTVRSELYCCYRALSSRISKSLSAGPFIPIERSSMNNYHNCSVGMNGDCCVHVWKKHSLDGRILVKRLCFSPRRLHSKDLWEGR